MGNCQAVDNASLVIQYPGGRADKLYWPVPATDIMKMNPGHYVALLLTTTTVVNPAAATATAKNNNNNIPVRITRIKLLKPTDTLLLGHVYRLITTQEVMKGLWAKKHGKIKQLHQPEAIEKMRAKPGSDSKTRSENKEHCNQVKNRSGGNSSSSSSSSSSSAKCKAWQPSLNSISESVN